MERRLRLVLHHLRGLSLNGIPSRERLEAAYPGYGFAAFLRLGIPAEWQRQALAGASGARAL